jgi:hypothetical protein
MSDAIWLRSPRAGSEVTGEIEVSAAVSDELDGVAFVRLQLSDDGLNWRDLFLIAQPPFRASWESDSVVDGDYLLRAVAVDRVRRETPSLRVLVHVENGHPAPPPAPPRLVPAGQAERAPWSIWELERLLVERGDEDPERRDERDALLFFLREYASIDGTIPEDFRPLVEETFAGLLERS